MKIALLALALALTLSGCAARSQSSPCAGMFACFN